jgi:hypothetical protein
MAHTERKLKMDKNDWETACFMKRHYNALTSQVFEPGKTETAFSGFCRWQHKYSVVN